jgi:hypothetical protein
MMVKGYQKSRMHDSDSKSIEAIASTSLLLGMPCSVLTTVLHGSESGLRMFSFSSRVRMLEMEGLAIHDCTCTGPDL